MEAATGRILYFNHDLTEPSGGVRTIYSHVAHLNRNGLSAYVVHDDPAFRPGWFPETVPTLYWKTGLSLMASDILVVPEDHFMLRQLKDVPSLKVVFCQNHFYAFHALPRGVTWHSLGIAHVLGASEVITNFVQRNLGWPAVSTVHCAIDQPLFKPREKKFQIACMPRKNPMIASFITGFLAALGGQKSQFKWVDVDGMSKDRVAEILAESAIFLSLSHLEGLGLPPIEAMASGCVVTGFHGYGGLEYATRENGFWCEEGNPVACAELLRNVVEMFLRGDAKLRQVIEAGSQTAARYTPERQEKEIVAFMQRLRGGG
jgi:hypothetical protein